MPTSRRDFLKKGSLIAVAAAVPTSIVLGASTNRTGAEAVSPYIAQTHLTKGAFLAQLHTDFRIRHTGSQVVVKLVEVTDLKNGKGVRAGKEGFSLLFSGEQAASLSQGTYELQHGSLGKFSFLLVPVKSKDKKVRSVEAIVNRLYP